MEKTQEGITVGGRIVKAVRFADDQAMVAATQKKLQEIMTVLHDTIISRIWYEDKYEENKGNAHQQEKSIKFTILIEGHKLDK